MDYTLALYNQSKIEELSIRATLHKLISSKGYPEAIRNLDYEPALGIRGLVVDRVHGNVESGRPHRAAVPAHVRQRLHGGQV